MNNGEHYDLVIIGTGAGGGTLAWKLAPSGKRIEAEDIAKMLDQEVLSDNHFSLIIKEVNSILGRRNKVR